MGDYYSISLLCRSFCPLHHSLLICALLKSVISRWGLHIVYSCLLDWFYKLFQVVYVWVFVIVRIRVPGLVIVFWWFLLESSICGRKTSQSSLILEILCAWILGISFWLNKVRISLGVRQKWICLVETAAFLVTTTLGWTHSTSLHWSISGSRSSSFSTLPHSV